MINEMIKKSDYTPIRQTDDNEYLLMWGCTPLMENVYQRDKDGNVVLDEEQKPIVAGQKETEYCMVCNETFALPTNGDNIVSVVNQGNAVGYKNPSMEEWTEWAKVFVPVHLQIQFLKERLKDEIRRYDKSKEVEDFSIGGVHMWFDSNKRTKVWENLMTAQQKGEENVTLRDGGLAFPMTVAMGWQLYYAVLDYARATWDVTEIHLAEASKLTTVEEILAYDYKQGYPEKLAF